MRLITQALMICAASLTVPCTAQSAAVPSKQSSSMNATDYQALLGRFYSSPLKSPPDTSTGCCAQQTQEKSLKPFSLVFFFFFFRFCVLGSLRVLSTHPHNGQENEQGADSRSWRMLCAVPGESGTTEGIIMAGDGHSKVISVDYRMPPEAYFRPLSTTRSLSTKRCSRIRRRKTWRLRHLRRRRLDARTRLARARARPARAGRSGFGNANVGCDQDRRQFLYEREGR